MEDKIEEKRSWVIFLIVGIIIGSIIGGIFGTYLVFSNPKVFPWVTKLSTASSSSSINTISVTGDVLAIETQVEEVVNKLSPSVVKITSTVNVVNPFFFQTIPQTGLGSGVIIREDGLILTNNHVIEDANDIEVTLSNGKTYKGTVVGADSISDLALLKINANGLTSAKLGDSSSVKVGQFVVAIGNPYGLDHTVTVGVVSAIERNIDTGEKTMYGVIQTDAAINPGNSGGPLVDLSGNIIGINTMIYSEAQGVGFAVSANTCKKVIDSILTKGKIEWPYLGVQLTTMTEKFAEENNLPFVEGACIISVQPLSPAARAGLKAGDIIISIDGKLIKNADEVVSEIRARDVGGKIEIELVRGSKSNKIKVQAILGSQH